MGYALRMSQINKSFSGVPVLTDVAFEVKEGEIHALLGENGAGKTTLMNILGGVLPMDSGAIELFGKSARVTDTALAQELGIAFVHQELNVVNDLAVYETMFLGHEKRTRFGSVDAKAMIASAREVFERMHVQIDPRAIVRDLRASYKQIVEIAKSVLFNARLIILDEPTTSLTRPEVENVFAVMRTLIKEHGATVIFISHKLGEVVDFCDSFTVLRNGALVGSQSIRDNRGELVHQADIARMMVGRNVLDQEVYRPRTVGEPLLKVSSLYVGEAVRDANFTLHTGEILGITGLLGDGKDELLNALFGAMQITSGAIDMKGESIRPSHPAKAKKLGLGMLPSNRKENSIIKDLSVRENMTVVTLDQYTTGTMLRRSKETQAALEYKDRLNIRVENLANIIVSLSGGNQQKVVLAKWLIAKPDVILLSNPTQGVDVGAKSEIYHIIMELAEQGMGIIITSGEAQEVLKICDRVLVMYHGEIRGELHRDTFSEEAVMILSTGGLLEQ